MELMSRFQIAIFCSSDLGVAAERVGCASCKSVNC